MFKMQTKNMRSVLAAALLGGYLLAPATAIGAEFVIPDYMFYNNGGEYYNVPPDQIVNYGTLNNLDYGLLDNSSVISNFGTLNNFDLGTVMNDGGGSIWTYSGGTLTNNGYIGIQSGYFGNQGITTNSGTLDSQGDVWNYATMTNQGSLSSGAYMDSYGTFDNQSGATMENSGTFWNHGQFDNAGEITSTSWFSNADGATFTNTGAIDNQHNLRNYGIFDNQGDIASDTTVLNEGTFAISGNLTGAGTYQQNAGATTVNGLLEADYISIDGGVLDGSGTVRGYVVVGPDGEVNPGNSPGTLFIDGDFELAIGGLLTLEVAGLGDFDRLIVSGDLLLGGDILFSLLEDYLLSDFLANFSIDDFFRSGDATNNTGFDPMFFAGASFGITDGNPTNPLWLLDGGTWSANAPSSGNTPVPEPSTLLLLAMGLGMAFAISKHRGTAPGSSHSG